ncbi:Pectate lyase superfamily protein [Roseivivax lentus]|uniref:Pectate lyase superfamily protein n=1 Tax=Roseivivax lentus TaxID=633194 RepID=A0A1N7MCS3_9RHOB|nr:glycosyl hydrolase family 28-related protein [Roseivivax lentus]SIS83945.1 Pectate lyase superfamily protein [Roseivivax lentus]
MNKAITDGVVLMPTPFSEGLNVWSSGDGRPGSDTYASTPTASFVAADQDFGGCLELLKTDATQRIRYMGEVPIEPGCYLRVTARVKCVSGSLPSVRVAAWAGNASGNAVTGIPLSGDAVAIPTYGQVVEVSAIIGSGNRGGVDLVWGRQPTYGHFGIDFTGASGGLLRVDDFVIEDVTSVFLREMLGYVDVRDYGARGDGVTDDSAAFEAADQVTNGRTLFVSQGSYFLGQDVTINSEVIFEGTVSMPTSRRLSLTKNFSLPSYIDAFGDEEVALKKALQSLMNDADHESLDMGGRRVTLSGPLDVQAAVANRTTYAQRRVLRNGQLQATEAGDWAEEVVTSQASYSPSNQFRLTNVTNIANIQVGSLVEGAGVGREIYVRSVNVGAGDLTLSQPLSDATGTQNYTFTRYKYMLDFSGFDRLDVFQIEDIEFQCAIEANGILLAPEGTVMVVRECVFNRPKFRGITSPGEGCQGMLIEHCQFISHEGGMLTQNRRSVAINVNANDVKVRDCRASQFRHFLVASGAQNLITGNHFFQGDTATNGIRSAGIVLALRACNTQVSNNYIDNCFVEWTNEREPEPDFTGGFGFAGLSITDNVFLCSNVATTFSYIVVKPYGTGHFLNGFNVSGNTFRASSGKIDRVERVDTSFANLEFGSMKRVTFSNNTFANVEKATRNPLVVRHDQNTHSDTWVVETNNELPFDGWAQEVDAVSHMSRLRNSANVSEWIMPYCSVREGGQNNRVHLIYGRPVLGDANVTIRMD